MPLVEDDLGGLDLYGWVFSAFFLGDLVGIVVAGHAADRMHPAKPFALGLVLFALGLLLGGLAPSMELLVAARVLQGLGAGALPATAYVCIARGYEPEVRPRMFALLSTAWVVPGIIGPALAAVVGETIGWRWVFLGLLPLVVVVGIPAVHAVRTRIPATGPTDAEGLEPVRDALLVAVAAGVFLAGLGVENRLVGLGLATGAAVLGVLVYRRLTPPGTLRAVPGLPATTLVRGLLTCAFFSMQTFVPLAIVDVRDASTAVVGLALAAGTLTWTAGAWIQDRLIYRSGPRILIRLGFVGILVGVGLVTVGLDPAVPIGFMVAALALTGLAMGPAYASTSVTALAEARDGAEGEATSALQLTDVLGVALGTGIAGAIVATGEDLDATLRSALTVVFAFSAVVAVLGAAVAGRVPSRLPGSGAQTRDARTG